MILERADVAGEELEPVLVAALAETPRQGHAGELHQAFERGEALARLGGEVALEPDPLHQRRQAATAPLVRPAREDLAD